MLDNVYFFKYVLSNSLIHKLSPMFKVISLFIMIFCMFFVNNYVDIIMLFSYLILAISYSNINIFVYFRNVYSMRYFILFISIITFMFSFSISSFLYCTFILMFIIIYFSIITYCTSCSEISYGIERIFKPLSKYISIMDISMIIMLSIRFIPIFTVENDRIDIIKKYRCIEYKNNNYKDKIINKFNYYKLIIFNSYRETINLADNMELRLFGYGKSRTNYRSNKWTKIDTFLLILNILILFIVIFY